MPIAHLWSFSLLRDVKQTKISPSGTGVILVSPSPTKGGGVEKSCVTYEYPGDFVVFIFFLASEEQVQKQLKQVSIVFWQESDSAHC